LHKPWMAKLPSHKGTMSQFETQEELDVLLPSVLDKAIKGEL
jgi:hypothetical protein